MSYVILDLEWNASYSKTAHRFVNEIIEIGAVKLDENLNVADTFTRLVSPQIGKRLSGKVKELTKITNEELRDGVGFITAMSQFSDFLADGVVMTWSDSDLHALMENYSYYTGERRVPFLRRYCNLQLYCEDCLGVHDSSTQLGLGSCAQMAGVNFSPENLHRALSDVMLTLECLRAFYEKFPIEPFISTANSDFYNRLLFKNHFITDINSPDVDKSKMFFDCGDCGARLVKKTVWKIHNRSFTANFCCKKCKKTYTGRISFKKRFDGVAIKKKLTEKSADNQTTTQDNSPENANKSSK